MDTILSFLMFGGMVVGVIYLKCKMFWEKEEEKDDDDFYEDLIPKLYKPAKKMKVVQVLTQTLPFKVDVATDEQPAHSESSCPTEDVSSEDAVAEVTSEKKEEPRQPTMIEKWKQWLNGLMRDVTE